MIRTWRPAGSGPRRARAWSRSSRGPVSRSIGAASASGAGSPASAASASRTGAGTSARAAPCDRGREPEAREIVLQRAQVVASRGEVVDEIESAFAQVRSQRVEFRREFFFNQFDCADQLRDGATRACDVQVAGEACRRHVRLRHGHGCSRQGVAVLDGRCSSRVQSDGTDERIAPFRRRDPGLCTGSQQDLWTNDTRFV